MNIIETQNLSFGFTKGDQVLNNLNLQVPRGSIYGFLGPNGSGKTTTIRLLLGLLPDPAKKIKLFGQSIQNHRMSILSKTGSLIEQPSLYEHLSGFDNLEITRRIRKVNSSRIEQVFALVGLGNATKKVKDYSLGMKQRLGLAIALLSEPELLILDEPINGLDPNGIIEIRELLVRLNNELGVTIFLSSHLLAEIEKIVTHLGVLNNGQLVYQGSYGDIKAMRNQSAILQINTSDNLKAAGIIRVKFPIRSDINEAIMVPFQNKEQTAVICQQLVEADIAIYQMQVVNKDLETIFLEITKN